MVNRALFPVIKLLKLSPTKISLSVVSAFLSSVFDGVSLALLVPVLRGLFGATFQSLYQLPIVGAMISENHAFIHQNKTLVFGMLISVVFATVILKAIFQYFALILISSEVHLGTHRIRVYLYDRLLGFGKLFFDRQNRGYLHQVLIHHTDQINLCFVQFSGTLQSILTSFFYIFILLKISLPMTLFVICVCPIVQIFIAKIIKKIQRSSSDYAKSFAELGRKITNVFNCTTLIKAYCREKEERDWFAVTSHRIYQNRYSIDKKQGFLAPLHEVVMITMVLALVCVVAFLLVKQGDGDIAAYLVFFVVLKKLLNNVSQISSFWGSLSGVSGQIAQMHELMTDEGKYIVPDGKRDFEGIKQAIQINDLDYSFPDKPISIRNLNVSFNFNQMTALVGESGSGKTTLINLLMRFYDPPENSIYIDDIDIRSFKIASLRSRIALVDQQDSLLNASLKFNLVYGLNREVSNDELSQVIEDAQLSKLLESLPEGLETNIGDRGVQLSGGEKQRVQIARAMLKKAEIMIFDEATSALDSKTESLIQKAVANLLKDKTSIVIAHRLSTIREADKIILIKNGQVLEHGNFEQLMAKKAHFYQHWIDQGLIIH